MRIDALRRDRLETAAVAAAADDAVGEHLDVADLAGESGAPWWRRPSITSPTPNAGAEADVDDVGQPATCAEGHLRERAEVRVVVDLDGEAEPLRERMSAAVPSHTQAGRIVASGLVRPSIGPGRPGSTSTMQLGLIKVRDAERLDDLDGRVDRVRHRVGGTVVGAVPPPTGRRSASATGRGRRSKWMRRRSGAVEAHQTWRWHLECGLLEAPSSSWRSATRLPTIIANRPVSLARSLRLTRPWPRSAWGANAVADSRRTACESSPAVQPAEVLPARGNSAELRA